MYRALKVTVNATKALRLLVWSEHGRKVRTTHTHTALTFNNDLFPGNNGTYTFSDLCHRLTCDVKCGIYKWFHGGNYFVLEIGAVCPLFFLCHHLEVAHNISYNTGFKGLCACTAAATHESLKKWMPLQLPYSIWFTNVSYVSAASRFRSCSGQGHSCFSSW